MTGEIATTEELTRRVSSKLLARSVVTEADLALATESARARGLSLEEALVGLGLITEDQVGTLLAAELAIPYVFPYSAAIDPVLLRLFPPDLLRRHEAIPLLREEGRIVLASPRLPSESAQRELRASCGEEVTFSLASRRRVRDVLQEILGPAPEAAAEPPAPPAGDPAAVALLYGHLARALAASASEVRFEPGRDHILVRYRLEGRLEEQAREPLAFLFPLIARVKILIGASSTAGAGSTALSAGVRVAIGPRDLALHISILPTRTGASVSILIGPGGPARLESLGISEASAQALRMLASEERGLVLIASQSLIAARRVAYAMGGAAGPSSRAVLTLEREALDVEPLFGQVECRNAPLGAALAAAVGHSPDVLVIGTPLDEAASVAVALAAAGSRLLVVVSDEADGVDVLGGWLERGASPSRTARTLAAIVHVSGEAGGRVRAVEVLRPDAALRGAIERRAGRAELDVALRGLREG